jgi:hypothetical protein
MPSRKERALAVRAAILPWLREQGRVEAVSEYRVLRAEGFSGFSFVHRTPFSGIPLAGTKPHKASQRADWDAELLAAIMPVERMEAEEK